MSIDLATVWAGLIAFAVLAYVILDGFDLGVGILACATCSMKATRSAWVRRSVQRPRTRPECTSMAAISAWVPWRMYSNSRRRNRPGFGARSACLRSMAWIPVFSSTDSTTEPLGA